MSQDKAIEIVVGGTYLGAFIIYLIGGIAYLITNRPRKDKSK